MLRFSKGVSLFAAAALLLLTAGGMTARAQTYTTAVLDLEAKIGVDQEVANALSDRLRQELFQTGKFNVIERSRMDAMLSEQGLGMAGMTSQEDAVQAGRILNVDMLVAGSISKIGTIYTLSARMFDVETGEMLLAESRDCQCSIEEVLTTQLAELAALLAGTTDKRGPSISGDPNLPGRLEFVYSGTKYSVAMDGDMLQANSGMKATVETGHGKHMLQIYQMKGMFSAEEIGQEEIFIPGGYIVRATYKDDVLHVMETVPIPGMQRQTTTASGGGGGGTSGHTTTTTTTFEESTPEVTMTVGGQTVTVPGMGVSITETTQQHTQHSTTMEAPEPEPNRPSKVIFYSEEGMCEIYVDGRQKAEIDIPGIDELGQATLFDMMPGTYQLKIEGFEVWYEGKLQVGSGEEIKIRVEPDRYEIIGRNPLPY